MPEKGDIWIHKRTRNRYFIMRLIKRRIFSLLIPESANRWQIGVLYCEDVDDIDGAQWYERPTDDFLESFEKVE